MALTHRMFSRSRMIFTIRIIGKPTRKAIKQRDEDPIAPIATTPPKNRPGSTCLPHYDGSPAFGVYIHITPGDEPNMPQGYTQVMDRHDLIMALNLPRGGNKSSSFVVFSLALDTLATLEGRLCHRFGQGLYRRAQRRGNYRNAGPALAPGNLVRILEPRTRYGDGGSSTKNIIPKPRPLTKTIFEKLPEWTSATPSYPVPDDWNYDHCVSSSKAWEDDGFDIRFFSISHPWATRTPPPGAFEEALVWVAESKRKR